MEKWQVMASVDEFAKRCVNHWAELMSTLICVTPQDDLITIKEKAPKKTQKKASKKSMKDQVEAEESEK